MITGKRVSQMKNLSMYLFVSLTIYISGCTMDLRQADKSILKYEFGDKVRVSSGFYARCYGNIVGYHDYGKGYVDYVVDATCINPSSTYAHHEIMEFRQEDLVKYVGQP
jgi:hypothetical protein